MLKWGRIQKWECKCFYLLFLYKKGMGYVYNFLNNEANRKLKFIEILHRQDDWITLSKIAEELDCSDKILRSDIKKINIDFSPFMIISSPNGVLLEYPHTINIEYIYSKTLRTSIEYQIIEHLFLNPGITITELSEILYTSEPGLRRKIKALSRQTEESGFNIEIIDSHCNLVGEEAQVRNFLVYYFFEKMYYEDAPFSSTERQVVGKIMDYFEKEYNRSYGMDARKEMENYLIISLRRVLAGRNLLTEDIRRKNVEIRYSLSFVGILEDSFLKREFFHVFKIELNQSLLEEITCVFTTYQFSLPNRGPKFDEKAFFQGLGANIGERIIQMSKDLQIPLYNIEDILKRVAVDLAIYVGPLFVLHDRNKLFVSRLERNYPAFIQYLKQSINSFGEKYDIEFEESLINQLIFSTVIEWKGLLTHLNNYHAKVKVSLLVDGSIEFANYLAALIEHQLGQKLDIAYIFNKQTKNQQSEIEKSQLLVTTISEYDSHGVPSICIDRNPSLNDLKHIKSLIEEITKEEFNQRLA